MPKINNAPNINNKPDKNTNTLQPARLAESQNSGRLNPGSNTHPNTMNSSGNNNWKTQTSKRNLSSSSSGSTSSKPSSLQTAQPKTKKLSFSTRNRYESLSIPEPTDTVFDQPTLPVEPIIAPFVKPPPPIFMKGITDYPSFCSTLIELIGFDNFFCKASADRLKIQTAIQILTDF
ncbi:formin-F-like [Rhopalosiphum maidis]|uniref:formin-F-like n=1 Tax=Rhopalosiphum maidis TaxID=43146 RepID=UPI000EFE8F3D|nr:formin-F-like [Rhopalosiphum maidis]